MLVSQPSKVRLLASCVAVLVIVFAIWFVGFRAPPGGDRPTTSPVVVNMPSNSMIRFAPKVTEGPADVRLAEREAEFGKMPQDAESATAESSIKSMLANNAFGIATNEVSCKSNVCVVKGALDNKDEARSGKGARYLESSLYDQHLTGIGLKRSSTDFNVEGAGSITFVQYLTR